VPTYPSAEALISDAQLRRDRFGSTSGILVVEGPDDKRLFAERTVRRQQVIAAGGRRLLLASHATAIAQKCDWLIFVTDCDYDVAMQLLRPAQGLVITEHTDLESDLLALGGWERIVTQLVPAALDDDDIFNEIVAAAMARTVALADVVGRYRRVAREFGFVANTDIRHVRYRRSGAEQVDEERLLRSLWQSSEECTLDLKEFGDRIRAISSDYNNCNGHDLVKALLHVLREDFGVRNVTDENLEDLLRHGVSKEEFESWSVTSRIKRWEQKTSVTVLRA
jgi:hypothetical protein